MVVIDMDNDCPEAFDAAFAPSQQQQPQNLPRTTKGDVKNFTTARVDLDECVGGRSESYKMGDGEATSFPKTRVDLDESMAGTDGNASNTETVKTAHFLQKTTPTPPMHLRQETWHPASKSRRPIFVVIAVGVVLLLLASIAAVVFWQMQGHWWRHESKESNAQNEDYCQICPEGFELSTPDAIFDVATSPLAIQGLTCAEVLENAQKGEYDIGLFCPLVQSEAAETCACRDPSQPVTGQPTTLAPTASPTSAQPSSSPTVEDLWVLPNPVPDNRPRSYFNYDINDTRFGPNAWTRIGMSGTYFREFGEDGFGAWDNHLVEHVSDPTKNRCGDNGKQSPVNLIKTTGEGGECTAAHQIRTRSGTLPLISEEIEKLIEPNKLRIKLNRRKCLDLNQDSCLTPRPPNADFPNYSSTGTHYSDLLHLDIKIPGEHPVRDEIFDAEIQMLHIHLTASRMAYIGVPVRATVDGYNENYQMLLDQFQIVYDEHKAECAAKQRRRGLRIRQEFFGNNNREMKQSFYSDDPDFQRRLQMTSKHPFDPYAAFVEWIFFYRYNGSSTEPPCFPLTWFVIERPIHINFQQLKQTQYLLFTHTNGDCEKTSVHNEDQSVVRPLQPLGKVDGTNEKREIMSCMEGEFRPDDPN